MKKENKWLLRKASGSRAERKIKGDYRTERNNHYAELDELPHRERIKHARSYLDTTLIRRWLYDKVGQNFDDVYSDFLTRIQPKYLDQYRESIFWYVTPAKLVIIKESGEIWAMGKFGEPRLLPNSTTAFFYVHPDTNLLCRVPDTQIKRVNDSYKRPRQ